MTDERFFQILEAYGADPARWPADERAEAEAFALDHPDLMADAAQSERDLDALLDQLIEPERASSRFHRICQWRHDGARRYRRRDLC